MSTREEELAALIAEQERDARYGHAVLTERRLSLDYVTESGAAFQELIGAADANLVEFNGESVEWLRRRGHRRRWSERQIISAIKKWVAIHGAPPTCNEWKTSPSAGIPASSSVCRRFGTWSAAIRAAGFEPRPHGGTTHPNQSTRLRSRIRKQRSTAYLTPAQVAAAYVIYEREGLSTSQLAERLYRKYGYGTALSCRVALQRAFHAEGFVLRTRAAGIAQFFATAEGQEERKKRSERATRQHARRRTADGA